MPYSRRQQMLTKQGPAKATGLRQLARINRSVPGCGKCTQQCTDADRRDKFSTSAASCLPAGVERLIWSDATFTELNGKAWPDAGV